MKKILFSILTLLMIITITGCEKTETIKQTINQEKEIIIDYSSSSSLSKAIKENKEVIEKYLKILVVEVIEQNDDVTKFKSNNNLEFITNEKLEINKGDYVILNIINKPIRNEDVFIVEFKFIKLIEIEEDEPTVSKEDVPDEKENPSIKETKIIMDKNSSEYVGLDKADIEKQLKDKGFSNVEFKEELTKDSQNKTNTIKSIVINGKEIIKDNEYKKDDKVVITYWKYEKPASEYELAFIRDMPSYDLYFMFDTDNKKAVYFGTNDSFTDNGSYTGDFSSGITISWPHGEWKDKFVYKNGSLSAMLTDGNGFEWKYVKCDVLNAEKILNSFK